MRVTIEDFVPYEKSVRWRLHDAYYGARGAAAWSGGDIPSYATSNFAIARQHARILLELEAELTASGRLAAGARFEVLEIGSGSGRFAENLLRALDIAFGDEGLALARRLRYVVTDFSEKNLRDALRRPLLSAAAAEGRVVPALYDMRAPGAARDHDGRPIAIAPNAVIASYVACVAPVKILRKEEGGRWLEKHVKVTAEAPEDAADPHALVRRLLTDPTRPDLMSGLEVEAEWRPGDLASLLAPPHADVVRDALGPFESGTAVYPFGWFDTLLALRGLAPPGALVLVSDYGHAEAAAFTGDPDPPPQHFGNTFSHGLNLALFDSFCAREGMGIVRTVDPCRLLHVVALRFQPDVPEAFRAAFRSVYGLRDESEQLLDLIAGAKGCALHGESVRSAARLLERATLLDPFDGEIAHRAADCWLEAGYHARAAAHFKRAREADPERAPAVDLGLGKACFAMGRIDEALALFQRSASARPGADADVNMAAALAARGEYQEAWAALDRAEARTPGHERARRMRSKVAERFAATLLGDGDGEEAGEREGTRDRAPLHPPEVPS